MNHYLVWIEGKKPEDGKIIAESSSFAARTVCANAWGVPVLSTMARRVK